MQWAMMQWARENNCTIYDFRGVADEAKVSKDAKADTSSTQSDTTKTEELSEKPAEKTGEKSADHLLGLNRFKAGFGADLVDYVGEFDLVLNPRMYWLWTNFKPKIVAFLKSRGKAASAENSRQEKPQAIAQ
jgi:hypothetical protein